MIAGAKRDASVAPPRDGGALGRGSDAPLAEPEQSTPGPSGGEDCKAESTADGLPDHLSCSGLYADIEHKDIASDVRAYTPAIPLWSDGAEKHRFIYLPEGTRIDASDPADWRFPVGTKLWKEFVWKQHRVETRLFEKLAEDEWVKTSYHWNEDESEATRFDGGEVDVAGDSYYIPSEKECEQCHKGRLDRALGFEPVLLGLDGAQGLTLARLIDEDLLEHNSLGPKLVIGDDGTGLAAPALGWLHVNCGVSCHNDNTGADGYSSDLRLRLPAAALDGSPVTEVASITTTVGVKAKTPRWQRWTRIVPGSPKDSLLYYLLDNRDPNNEKDRMPPIASQVVDSANAKRVADWISRLP